MTCESCGHRAALAVIDVVIGNDRVSEQGWTAPLFRTRVPPGAVKVAAAGQHRNDWCSSPALELLGEIGAAMCPLMSRRLELDNVGSQG